MKCLFALLQLFLIFQIALNANIQSDQPTYSYNVYNALTSPNYLESTRGAVILKMQDDGNVVLGQQLTPQFKRIPGGRALWSSGTYGKGVGPYTNTLTNDGYLVLTDSTQKELWRSTKNFYGVAPFSLSVLDAGNMQIQDANGNVVWDTNTRLS